jgi:hypothetical protein
MPPDLYRLIITCDDVREIVQILGEKKAEEAARAAGATRREVEDVSEFILDDVASRDGRLDERVR